jgi:hypothetical protein
MFEGHGFMKKYLNRERWIKLDYAAIYNLTKYVYVPLLLEKRDKRDILVDLGHHSLYIMNELLSYIHNETKLRILIVRIRRERYETALSLISRKENEYRDVMNDWYGYSPFEKLSDVILKVSDSNIWNRFNNFQHALWFMDEVELRWKRILKNYPWLDHIEVTWSKQWPNSFEIAANSIAKAFGGKFDDHREVDLKKHLNDDYEFNISSCVQYDMEYRSLINISAYNLSFVIA